MGAVIGELLPLAVAVAISPLPIIAAILMLLSARARSTSLGFLLGWLAGIIVAVVVFTLLGSLIEPGDDGPKPVAGVIKIVLGVLLLLLAVGQWRKRPKPGEQPALPKWMAAIDTITPVASLGLGFLLAAVNPKNLMMAVAAGVTVGGSTLSGGLDVAAIAIYVVIAASTVAIPVVAFLIAANRLRPALDALRVWLLANNATVMAVLLLVLGVANIGKGIGSF